MICGKSAEAVYPHQVDRLATEVHGQDYVSLDTAVALERQVSKVTGREEWQRMGSCARVYKSSIKGFCSVPNLSFPSCLPEP